MTFTLRSQVNVTSFALLKLAVEMPALDDAKMVVGLGWVHRGYETRSDGTVFNEKFKYFEWGGYLLIDIPKEYIWRIGEANLVVQDGRWKKNDPLKMRVKGSKFILESA